MAQIFGSFGEAFGYAGKNTFCRPLQWIGIAIIVFLSFFAFIAGSVFLLDAFVGNILRNTIGLLGFNQLLDMLPVMSSTVTMTIGIVGLVIGILLSLFLTGVMVQILGGRDVTFKGFFGSIGRGFQLIIITLIYQIVVVIITLALCLGYGALANMTSGALFGGISIGFMILLIVLGLFFAIFMLPAQINFATQRKFGAAFHFKEIGAMIGRAKWYKIIVAAILLGIVTILLCLVLSFIVGLLDLIPVAGFILSLIFYSLFSVFIAYFYTSYWAKFFLEA